MASYGRSPSFGDSLGSNLDMNGKDITGTGNIMVSGILQGGIDVQDHSGSTVTLDAEDCYGSIHQATKADGGQTFNLPPVVKGMFVTIKATKTQILTINPDDADRIIFGSTTKADGATVVSGGSAAAVISLYGDSVNGWTVAGYVESWT